MEKQKKTNRNPWFVVVGIILVITASSYLLYLSYFYKPPVKVAAIGQPTSAPVASGVQSAKTPAEQYTVPADHPKQLTIDKLGINANIISLGTLKDGSLDAPKTAWDVGWYKDSTLPGSGYGALLIDGHVNDALNSPGVFYKLDTLVAGDTLKITRGDGQQFTYSAVEVDQTPTAQVDMSKMQRPITPGTEGLNLITCGGVYNYKLKTYTDRILVYATRTS